MVDCELFYINFPESETFQHLRRVDLKGNNLSDCPVLTSMPLLEVLVLDNNLMTSRSTFHSAPLLHTLWLNNNSISNLVPLAASITVAFPKLRYLSMMFNPCHPSVLPGATEQSFRQYRLLIVTLLPRIEAIDAVCVDPDEKAVVREQIEGELRLSSVNVVDALDIERLQPYLNPLKLPLPYPGTVLLEGTVTIQTGLSGKLFAASQKVYLRLSMTPSSSGPFFNIPMFSWTPYSESRCPSSAEVEHNGLPQDLFETQCTCIVLVPGFTIGPTKNVRPGFKRCTRIDWPTAGVFRAAACGTFANTTPTHFKRLRFNMIILPCFFSLHHLFHFVPSHIPSSRRCLPLRTHRGQSARHPPLLPRRASQLKISHRLPSPALPHLRSTLMRSFSLGFKSVTATGVWTSAVQWAVDAAHTIQKYAK